MSEGVALRSDGTKKLKQKVEDSLDRYGQVGWRLGAGRPGRAGDSAKRQAGERGADGSGPGIDTIKVVESSRYCAGRRRRLRRAREAAGLDMNSFDFTSRASGVKLFL